MKDKKIKVGDILIDDTPIDFSNVPELTDEEYEAHRAKRRKEIENSKTQD